MSYSTQPFNTLHFMYVLSVWTLDASTSSRNRENSMIETYKIQNGQAIVKFCHQIISCLLIYRTKHEIKGFCNG